MYKGSPQYCSISLPFHYKTRVTSSKCTVHMIALPSQVICLVLLAQWKTKQDYILTKLYHDIGNWKICVQALKLYDYSDQNHSKFTGLLHFFTHDYILNHWFSKHDPVWSLVTVRQMFLVRAPFSSPTQQCWLSQRCKAYQGLSVQYSFIPYSLFLPLKSMCCSIHGHEISHILPSIIYGMYSILLVNDFNIQHVC